MAVIKQRTLISPSADLRSLVDLGSTSIESGIYYCTDSATIKSVTSSLWTVICVSNEDMGEVHCYSQIWIPSSNGSSNLGKQSLYLRTSAAGSSTYSEWTEFVSSSTPVSIEVATSQPALSAAGETKLWIKYPSS